MTSHTKVAKSDTFRSPPIPQGRARLPTISISSNVFVSVCPRRSSITGKLLFTCRGQSEPIGAAILRLSFGCALIFHSLLFCKCISGEPIRKVATTGPFASPTLTSNLDPSWVTAYVLMVSIFAGFAGYDPIRGSR
jgi:hypothetical protein